MLDALPRGDANRRVAQFIADRQLGEQLFARQFAAGDPRADHKDEGLVSLAPFARRPSRGPRIAIVLLIETVRLEQMHTVLAEEIVFVEQLLPDLAAQVVAVDLCFFDRVQLFFLVGSHDCRLPGVVAGRSPCDAERIRKLGT